MEPSTEAPAATHTFMQPYAQGAAVQGPSGKRSACIATACRHQRALPLCISNDQQGQVLTGRSLPKVRKTHFTQGGTWAHGGSI